MVFFHNEQIGGPKCVFGGELIDHDEYDRRYSDAGSGYVLSVSDEIGAPMHDETRHRTCLSYANDGVCAHDSYLRRNYVYSEGTHVVWHIPEWPHVVNARCHADLGNGELARLYAIGNITHDSEILWSYSGSHEPGRGRGLRYTCTEDGRVQEIYWNDADGV